MPYKTTSIATMAVSYDMKMAWNPNFVTELSLPEVMWCLIHELFHPMLNHHRRWLDHIGLGHLSIAEAHKVVAKDPRLQETARDWNIAADAAANQKLEELAKMVRENLPEGYVSPTTIGAPYGQIVETYYDHVRKLSLIHI